MKAQIIKNSDRLLAAASYAIFFPALFIALTDKRKLPYDSLHAAQAINLWTAFLIINIFLRLIYSFLSGVWYFILYDLMIKIAHSVMWGYAAYCGLLAFREQEVEIPYITGFAKKIL